MAHERVHSTPGPRSPQFCLRSDDEEDEEEEKEAPPPALTEEEDEFFEKEAIPLLEESRQNHSFSNRHALAAFASFNRVSEERDMSMSAVCDFEEKNPPINSEIIVCDPTAQNSIS